jgi:flagellar protein FliO/FliZ
MRGTSLGHFMDAIDIVRYFGALILVLGLLGLAWMAARKYGLPGLAPAASARRISIVETLMLDARHKAFLIRRDGTEHLVMIGPQGMITVENGIAAAPASPAPSPPTEESA